MGFRFQRRIKIIPGVTLNVGKRGVSTSIGRRGAHITFGQNGVRTTAGISYTSLSKPSQAPEAGSRDAEALGPMSGVSSGAGAAAAGGCGALPRVRAGV